MRPNLVRRSILPIVLFTMAVADLAAAQSSPGRPSYGTSDLIFYPVLQTEFRPFSSTAEWEIIDGGLTTSFNPTLFRAPVRLPNGALLTHLELDYFDDHALLGVHMQLFQCGPLMNNCVLLGTAVSNDGPGGTGFVVEDLTGSNITISNSDFRYLLNASTATPDTRILGAYVVYKLQVRPAPASATFTDVPTTHPFFRFVEALVDAGITAGCAPGLYCVDSPITRGEMAVFLSVALGLHFPG